jgi:hypothetical protein
MRLLLTADHWKDWPEIARAFKLESEGISNGNLMHSDSMPPFSADLLELGSAGYESAAKLSKVLSKERYHLVLHLGTALPMEATPAEESWMNVIRVLPLFSVDPLITRFEARQTDPARKPHQRGGLINMTNSYFNAFLPIPKVLAYDFPSAVDIPEIDTPGLRCANAAAISFSCLLASQPFYQLRWVLKEDRSSNYDLAQEQLLNILQQIR